MSENVFGFFVVNVASAGHGAAALAPRVLEARAEYLLEAWLHERPGAHVAMLLLRPDDLFDILVLGECVAQLRRRKRAQLFDAH